MKASDYYDLDAFLTIVMELRPVGSCFKPVRPGGVVMGVAIANLYYTITFQS